jgi:hypothetical protein
LPSAPPASRRSCPTSMPGCEQNVASSRAIPRSPRRWITCSSAGAASRGSSPMAGFA